MDVHADLLRSGQGLAKLFAALAVDRQTNIRAPLESLRPEDLSRHGSLAIDSEPHSRVHADAVAGVPDRLQHGGVYSWRCRDPPPRAHGDR